MARWRSLDARTVAPTQRRIRGTRREEDRAWGRNPIADSLASVLRLAWTWNAETIAADPDLLISFTDLLNLLSLTRAASPWICERGSLASFHYLRPTTDWLGVVTKRVLTATPFRTLGFITQATL